MTRYLALALVVFACGGKGPSSGSRIVDGSDVELADCEAVGKVSGTADNSHSNEVAEQKAKDMAREKAAALGATHVKWIVPCCTFVEGQAYRCDAPTDELR